MKNGSRQREAQRKNVRESLQSEVDRLTGEVSARGVRLDAADDEILRLNDDLRATEDAAEIAEEEVKRLRQGIWEAYAALGFDTDGQATPEALVSDIVALIVNAAMEFRKDYDEALQHVPDPEPVVVGGDPPESPQGKGENR